MAIIALERKSSIEAEPRTLTVAELQVAREAAMFMLNNNLMEEARKIFTEGLKPVPSIRDYDLFEDCDDEYEEEAEEEEEEEEGDEMRDWVELEQSYHTCLQIDVANASF